MLMPAYTRPPHCRYPTTLDECARIYFEVVRRYGPENVIVMGDSAGGNLAVTTLLRACREGVPKPAGLVLMSPWVDLTEVHTRMHVCSILLMSPWVDLTEVRDSQDDAYMHARMYACTYACMRVCMYVCMHVCMRGSI